jgi:hypothetical protein
MAKQTQLITTGFDYSTVAKDAKGKLIYLAGQINRDKAAVANSLMSIGKHIADAHELLKGNGKFSDWVQDECGFSRRTAYNYMLAYQRFYGCEGIAQISQDAMYALSGPDTPPAAFKEAVKLAGKGERIDMKQAKNLLLKFSDGEDARDHHASNGNGKPKAAKPEPDAAALFTEALEHLRQLTLLLDKINRLKNNTGLRSAVFDSLEVANQDLLKWRKFSST